MFRLVHISDAHLGPLPPVRAGDLLSKRILGYINWKRNRSGDLEPALEERLLTAIAEAAPDHLAVTGDLVNLALAAEVAPARRFLERLGTADTVSLVPGNHDAYVPGAVGRAVAAWGAWMRGDGMAETAWPYLRRRGPLAIIGVSTALATGPFMATGRVGRDQAAMLEALLSGLGDERLCRVLLIHHPPTPGGPGHKRLTDAGRIRALVARHGVDIVLHGHTHLPTRAAIPGPGGSPVPVVGVPAALQRPGGKRPASGFNVIDVEDQGENWRITVSLRQLQGSRTDNAPVAPDQRRYVEAGRAEYLRPVSGRRR